MITEDYVSRETAILLKEKGFHEPVRYEYHYYNTVPSFHRHLKDFNGQEYEGLQSEWYSAPTQQRVMKWLRKVHNLEIYPFHDTIQENNNWWFRIEKHTNGCGITLYESDFIYLEYEEAVEEAIKYCLEKLI